MRLSVCSWTPWRRYHSGPRFQRNTFGGVGDDQHELAPAPVHRVQEAAQEPVRAARPRRSASARVGFSSSSSGDLLGLAGEHEARRQRDRLGVLAHEHARPVLGSERRRRGRCRRRRRRSPVARARRRPWSVRRLRRCRDREPRRSPSPGRRRPPARRPRAGRPRRRSAPARRPWASIASLTARTSAAALGPATSIAPAGLASARPAPCRGACARPVSSSSSCGMALARSSPSVVATRLPAGSAHARLLDARVDHVALLAVAPDGGHPHAPALRLELAQQRRERLGLAGVLGQAHERQAPGRCGQLAEHRRISRRGPPAAHPARRAPAR